jgi:hypothetical protein
MSNARLTKRQIDRKLQDACIVIKRPAPVADATSFLKAELGSGSDCVVVVEETDRVITIPLAELSITEKTLHLHGFSKSACAQARAARTTAGWIGDAVRECDAGAANAQQVLAQEGRMMCLGERVPGTTTCAEARIKPYQLPVKIEAKQLDVTYRNYYEETATGRLACIAHRAVEFVAREVK